ncbi:MAG: hypothetical protein NTX53_20915, partial [candidate division WOR-3 bacterium]|nr:hypothetical protein [candidate division WOR-3 bacterium]
MKPSPGSWGLGALGLAAAAPVGQCRPEGNLRRFWALVLTIVFLGAACQKQPAAQPGLRVVSLVPSVTEIVYAVGAGKALVGNTNQCDFPEAAKSVYKVGDFMTPD